MFRGNEMMAAFVRAQLVKLAERTAAGQANVERLYAELAGGVPALLACRRLVSESRADQRSRFDLAGVALITACLVADYLADYVVARFREMVPPAGIEPAHMV